VQAWAAKVAPRIEMNPILLKPQGDQTSQVILGGRSVGTTTAADYYEQFFHPGWQVITQSLQRLEDDFDLLVCEGAGSPAEINLKHRDLTNMRVARHLDAPTLLVVDIDRGGAFAHVVGTLELLEPQERELVRGIVINKFRGQRSILQPGIDWLEQRTGIPVIGVLPWIDRLFPAEDSLDLLERRSQKPNVEITIAVVRLPRISNFTDFDPLEAEPSVKVQYLGLHDALDYPDAVIIPGSKTTISDLLALQNSGLAAQIQDYAAGGGTLLGICGGFQILGESLTDPEGLEGEEGRFEGLGLLPIRTLFTGQKTTRQRQVTSNYPQPDLPVMGYEIHNGQSQLLSQTEHCNPLFDEPQLGLVNTSQSIWGTYLHGIFDNGPWRRAWLNRLRQQRGLKSLPTGIANYRAEREVLLDQIADTVTEHLEVTTLLSFLD
jgi:adenosylcobyric acid synthase